MSNDDGQLLWLEASKKAEQLLVKAGLPMPKPPRHLLGKEYDFPSNPATLSTIDLGRIKLELAALRGHTQRLLAERDVVLHELEMVFDLMSPMVMLKLVKTGEFQDLPRAALVKDVLRAAAIDRDNTLKNLYHRIVTETAVVMRLKAQFEIYEGHYAALSREQSRREASARVGIME